MTAQLEGQQALFFFDEEPPAHRHDLPPLWDGVPVAWREWSRVDSTLILHLPADAFACDKCGAIDESDISNGRRGQLINLTAYRCRHCGHDTVHDHLTDQWWDLDQTDYADIGSNEGAVL